MPIEVESMPEPHAAIAFCRTVMVLGISAPAWRPGQVCDAFDEIQRFRNTQSFGPSAGAGVP